MKAQDIGELLETLDIAIIVGDRDKKIVYANLVARKKIFHNNPELFYGKDVSIFYDKYARKKIRRLYSGARKGRISELPFIKFVDISKGTTTYVVKINEILDNKGTFAGFVAVFFDVTSITMSESKNQIKKIPVREDNKIVFVDVDKIVNIKAVKGKVYIVDNEQRKFVTNLSLDELEKRFYFEGIFRVHRCCLVNLKYMKSIVTYKVNKHFVEFIFDSIPPIPISRRSYIKLEKLFLFWFR